LWKVKIEGRRFSLFVVRNGNDAGKLGQKRRKAIYKSSSQRKKRKAARNGEEKHKQAGKQQIIKQPLKDKKLKLLISFSVVLANSSDYNLEASLLLLLLLLTQSSRNCCSLVEYSARLLR